jgi:hypothetical protein
VKRIFFLVIGWLVGCSGQVGEPGRLTEGKFVDVCVEMMALQTTYAGAPDSLSLAREAVFSRRGLTREEVAQFIEFKKAHPQQWESVVMLLKDRLGEGANISMKTFQEAKGDSSRQKKAGQ